MRNRNTNRWVGLLLVAIALSTFLLGCGSGRPPTYPTKGKVELKGKTYAGLIVLFKPVAGKDDKVPLPRGITNEDGTFEVTTFDKNDGAPKGDYAVTVIYESVVSPLAQRPKIKPPAIPAKYMNPTSTPFKATIKAEGENTLEAFKIP